MTIDIDIDHPDLTADPETQNEIFLKAFNTGDGAVFDAFYRDDAISNLSGQPLTGPERSAAITEMLAKKPSLKSSIRASYATGDTSLVIVDFELKVSGPDGQPATITGTCTDVLRRVEDGRWLMAIDRPVADQLPEPS